MEVRFADSDLDRMETDADYRGRYPQAVVKAFRKVMGWVWSATDERDLYELKGLHFEHLKTRPGQHSLRLNDQWRLIIEFEGNNPKTIVIVAIEDYH